VYHGRCDKKTVRFVDGATILTGDPVVVDDATAAAAGEQQKSVPAKPLRRIEMPEIDYAAISRTINGHVESPFLEQALREITPTYRGLIAGPYGRISETKTATGIGTWSRIKCKIRPACVH